ncbi:MAG: hypothetical protein U5N58_05050 [Actinomycetota bacterium]|nr:hypothetical protein [Actinomycetota bacterium]
MPYGPLQGLPGRVARKSYVVSQGNRNGCSICRSVCEAEAVTVESKKADIDKTFCPGCGAWLAVIAPRKQSDTIQPANSLF